MASRYIHLHTHSHYSFLQALPKIPELVAATKKNNMSAVALTDAGNLHGAIEFYKTAIKAEIKPVIGVDTYLAARSRFDKDPHIDTKRSRIVLLAETYAGYSNLLALVTSSYTDGFFERPRVDKDILREHAQGIIALIPSFAGDIGQMLAVGDREGAGAALAEYKSIFGTNNIFLEISHHPRVKGHTKKMSLLVELSKESGVPVVAQQDVYYISPKDREATEIMRRIQHGASSPYQNEDEDFSFTNEKQMLEYFKDIPEAVYRSCEIAERCNVELTLGTFIFPDFPLPKGKTADEVLHELCLKGMPARGMTNRPDVLERLEYELGIIKYKGYAAYFLVVEDLVRFAAEHNIYTNIRGSVAGSMTTYLLQITKIDPLEYKIPFERFLNPERPSAPDIDMDFADDRRDEVIEYARNKYGLDKVAQIGTFGTMMARAAVRDVARALGHPYGTGDRIAKLIPLGSQGFPMTIEHALKLEPDLKILYKEDDDTREILSIAQSIEGCVRQVGVHAAGVVISPTPLVKWTPLQPDPKGTGKLITQYDMYSVGEDGVGLTKLDFLGITNLAILADSVARVNEIQGISIDIEAIPIDDEATFAMLARGDTEGVFQLNGSGMTRWLKELKPTTIHDINAMVALYRPGPMQFIPQYIERKHNPDLITYLDPAMEPILKQTYGILVYQDDLLIMAHEFAGYSWGEVDKFRKAVGKKIPAEMQRQKEKFIDGCITHSSWQRTKAERVWEWIEPFAAYGFNKAHSASYGRVSYQTAYMKANYPVEYMSALLTAADGDTEEIAKLVAECKRLGIPVLPPDINESGSVFTVVDAPKNTSTSEQADGKAIRFGLSSIKNFGEGISKAILDERISHNPYETLAKFLSRVGSKNLNRKSLESLIKCGALDRFGERATLLKNVELLLTFHREMTAPAPQHSLFGTLATPATLALSEPECQASLQEKLEWEKELLGIYISGHPLDAHREVVGKSKLTIEDVLAEPQPGLPIILPVMIADVRTILTKKGEKMAFVRFEDKTGSVEGAIFPRLLKEHSPLIVSGTCVLIKGHVSNRNGEISLALDALKKL